MAIENHIKADKRCTGCNICTIVCPKHAIELLISEEGFWYPSVNKECVNCGKCIATCPVYGEKPKYFKEPISYAAWNDDDDVHLKSSSGGIFSLLAENVLKKNGIVYGAAYTEDCSVQHIRISSIDDIEKLRGSKYVQSFISKEIYSALSADISSGRSVLFSGTPCQVAAVNKLLGSYNNLLTVDVVCHGVPSPKAWKSYLREISQESDVQKVDMRYKKHYGWNKYHMLVWFQNGDVDDQWFNDNLWGKSFVHSLFLRNSCYECEFKEYIRNADISLGDFWEAARGTHREYDDNDKGTSVILVNSVRGQEIINHLHGCKLQRIQYEWIPARTYAVERSSARNEKREIAFAELDSKDFSAIVKKYTKPDTISRIKRKICSLIKG